MLFSSPQRLAGALLLLAAPLSGAPLRDAWTLADHGRRAEFVVARDEWHRARQPQRVAARATVEEVRRDADAAAGELVLYERGVPHTAETRRLVTKELSVRLAPGSDATAVAAAAGLVSLGPAPGAPGWLLFRSLGGAGSALEAAEKLRLRPGVLAAEPLLARQQTRRALPAGALYQDQWYLHNAGGVPGSVSGVDLNIGTVWNSYRGAGINIGIVDDGLQRDHPDLSGNYDPALSYDFDYQDADPLPPPYDGDSHGTACAGLAAASGASGAGTYGVAYEAHLAGLRLISRPTTDAEEAAAFAWRNDAIQIKSNSWGPSDTGYLIEGPGPLAIAALEEAVQSGRQGLGTIFLWAGGNGARAGDSSSFDGYAARREVIATGAVTNGGVRAPYSESGANLLCVAPSDGGTLSIPSADRPGTDGYNAAGTRFGDYADLNYTRYFGGTSATTPQVAGAIALMLQARPDLGWRDVKAILLRTAAKVNPADSGWFDNNAGHHFNRQFGAGLIDVQAAVHLAATWTKLPAEISTAQEDSVPVLIPDNRPAGVTKLFAFAHTGLQVEQVAVTVDLQHALRGQVEVSLISPAGTTVLMAPTRARDRRGNLVATTFTTPFFWDEGADGTWTVRVADRVPGSVGRLQHVKLELFGSPTAGRATDAGATVTADANQNGALDPGETATVSFGILNDGTATLAGATATLLPGAAISDVSGPVTLGDLPPGSTAAAAFTFTTAAPLGATLHPVLEIRQGGVLVSTVTYQLVIGTQATATFSSTGALEIPAYPRTIGPASPYGSRVAVSGLPPGAVVTRVVLHLSHLFHTRSADLDMLLVSPQRLRMIPLSDAGDAAADDLDLTLADDAETALPDLNTLNPGRYRPTNYGSSADLFPAPAPAGPYGSTFSVFNGSSPAGDWLLYVRDDASGGYGGLGSWSLEITYAY